jgi:hypothetical protein
MDILLYPLFVLGYMVLFLYCYRLFQESPFWGTTWIFFLVTALMYDNLILMCGRWIGFGETLEVLSMIRYLLHVLLIPTLTFVSLDFLRRSKVHWVKRVAVIIMVNLYTFIVTILGVFHDFLWVQLEAISINGIDRYIISGSPFSISVFFAFLPVFFTSIVVWKKMQWSILFIGCMIVVLLGTISYYSGYFALASLTELIFMIFLVLTEYKLKQEDFSSDLFEA